MYLNRVCLGSDLGTHLKSVSRLWDLQVFDTDVIKFQKKSKFVPYAKLTCSTTLSFMKSRMSLTVQLHRASVQDTADNHYAQYSAFDLKDNREQYSVKFTLDASDPNLRC